MAVKKKALKIDPEFLEKQKASLVRSHRHVIYFNEKEMAAIDEYCRRFKVESKSAIIRQSVMEHILKSLDENHPTLF